MGFKSKKSKKCSIYKKTTEIKKKFRYKKKHLSEKSCSWMRLHRFANCASPTALLLAQKYPVVGVDSNEKIIKTLNTGNLPFKEKGLDTLFQKVRGNFKHSTTVEPSDSFIIAVRPSISVRLKYDWIFLLRTYSDEIKKTGKAAVHCKGIYTQIIPTEREYEGLNSIK